MPHSTPELRSRASRRACRAVQSDTWRAAAAESYGCSRWRPQVCRRWGQVCSDMNVGGCTEWKPRAQERVVSQVWGGPKLEHCVVDGYGIRKYKLLGGSAGKDQTLSPRPCDDTTGARTLCNGRAVCFAVCFTKCCAVPEQASARAGQCQGQGEVRAFRWHKQVGHVRNAAPQLPRRKQPLG